MFPASLCRTQKLCCMCLLVEPFYLMFSFAGYGHVTPLSEGGKVFCIVYACIGIPLTLIMFTALVERLLILTSHLLRALQGRFGHLYQAFHIRLMHFSILLLVLIIVFFLIPAAVFTAIEERWNYLDAFYYCFISLTTIGLGDYIPGDEPDQRQRPLYKILTTCEYWLALPVEPVAQNSAALLVLGPGSSVSKHRWSGRTCNFVIWCSQHALG